jgi:hypothetical protein
MAILFTAARLSGCHTRGEQVTASKGYEAKLVRPLDFVVIADHSDGMGFLICLPLVIRRS